MHLLSLAKFLSYKFLSCVNDYIEDMATFTTLAKIYCTEYFCNTKVAGLGEIFVKQNFHVNNMQKHLLSIGNNAVRYRCPKAYLKQG